MFPRKPVEQLNGCHDHDSASEDLQHDRLFKLLIDVALSFLLIVIYLVFLVEEGQYSRNIVAKGVEELEKDKEAAWVKQVVNNIAPEEDADYESLGGHAFDSEKICDCGLVIGDVEEVSDEYTETRHDEHRRLPHVQPPLLTRNLVLLLFLDD